MEYKFLNMAKRPSYHGPIYCTSAPPRPVTPCTAHAIWYTSMHCTAGKLRITFPRFPLKLPACDLIVSLTGSCGRLHFGPQGKRQRTRQPCCWCILGQTQHGSAITGFQIWWFPAEAAVRNSVVLGVGDCLWKLLLHSEPKSFLSRSFSDFVTH